MACPLLPPDLTSLSLLPAYSRQYSLNLRLSVYPSPEDPSLWPYMVLYAFACRDMPLHALAWLHMALHALACPAWPYMALHAFACPCMPCMPLHGPTWPCMPLHALAWPNMIPTALPVQVPSRDQPRPAKLPPKIRHQPTRRRSRGAVWAQPGGAWRREGMVSRGR